MNDLKALSAQSTLDSDVPMATSIAKNIPIYDCTNLASQLEDPTRLKIELAENLLRGPGAFVLKSAYTDTSAIDKATRTFLDIIAKEKAMHGEKADHFGANDRVWNSLEKLCFADTKTFIQYHSNRWIELAAEAWLGPGFQMTTQVNLVRPGGEAQEAHCDYHLGFMTKDQVALYPPHVHALSPQITLQGAIAHCDMPEESGTTKLLPFSQNWSRNYADFRQVDVRNHFEQNCVQLPLKKGDILFFSPGLLHGAGKNKTKDIDRMANLLQVSSPFGVAMETINRAAMCKHVYPLLQSIDLSIAEKTAAIASTGEGYPFPTSLDTDPPIGGLAPTTQQALMRLGLEECWSVEKFVTELDAREAKRLGLPLNL